MAACFQYPEEWDGLGGFKEGGSAPQHSLLFPNDVFQAGDHELRAQRAEAKPRAPGLQRWDDLGQVVTDEAETGVFCELFDHWPGERALDIRGPRRAMCGPPAEREVQAG